ncbi:MAG: hypothetical protein ACLGIV_14740 [Actinomycetes bacterium]
MESGVVVMKVELRWVPVTQADGRQRLEMRWIVPQQVETDHVLAA